MKRQLFLVGLLWIIASCTTAPVSDELSTQLSKKDRIDLAIAHEVEMTKDPSTGTVPRERLLKSYAIMEKKKQSMKENYSITWEERGPDNVGGRTRAIIFDQNDPSHQTVFAGSVAGGLWTCSNIYDANPNWTVVNDFFDNLAVTSIVQDPIDPDVLYFGTGEGFFNADAVRGLGIWKSTDGGTTWNQLGSTNNSTFHYIQKLIISQQGTLFAATRNNGVQRSTDGGNSWSDVLSSDVTASSNRAGDIEEAQNGDLYAGMGLFSTDGVYKSTDDGVTWSKLTNGLPGSGYARVEIATAPSDSNRLYVLLHETGSNDCEGIYTSSDAGANFSTCDNPAAFFMDNFCRGQAWYDLIAAVDPNDPERLFIGGIDLLVSSDAGTSFTQISQWYGGGGYEYVHADQHIILFRPGSSDTLINGSDGGIALSTNASSAPADILFSIQNSGYNVTQFYGCALHPDIGLDYFIGGTQDNGSHLFQSSGINSTTEVTGGDGAFIHIDQNHPDTQITSYVYNNYWVTIDGGNTTPWPTRFINGTGRFINPTDYDNDDHMLYAATFGGSYLRWSDFSGTDSSIVAIPELNGRVISAVTASPNITHRIYFGNDQGEVVLVEDAHTNTPTSSTFRTGSGYVSCIEIETGNEDHVLVTMSNYGVNSIYETTDAGATWTSVEGDLPDMPVRWALFNPHDADQAMIATELGVWYTDNLDGSNTVWNPENTGMANVRTDMLQWRPSDNEIIAATHGRGIYSTSSFEIALPLEWMSFTAEVSDQQEVHLDWTTAHEFNNDGFTIQRSLDGHEFINIDFAEAKNKPLNQYTLIDTDLPYYDGTLFYRILQTDRDGSQSYSEVRRVYLRSIEEELGIWPNPISDEVNLSVINAGHLQIFNSGGHLIWSQDIQPKQIHRIPSSDWLPGSYYFIFLGSKSRERIQRTVIKQ
jgi:photosystem II stability/assembly factor-like uncharacterized protein